MKRGKYKEALRDYKSTLKLKPEDAGIRKGMARLYASEVLRKCTANLRLYND